MRKEIQTLMQSLLVHVSQIILFLQHVILVVQGLVHVQLHHLLLHALLIVKKDIMPVVIKVEFNLYL